MPDSGRTPREIAAQYAHEADQEAPTRLGLVSKALLALADELEAGKWVRVPDGDGPFGLLDGELVPLTVVPGWEYAYRFPVPEDPADTRGAEDG